MTCSQVITTEESFEHVTYFAKEHRALRIIQEGLILLHFKFYSVVAMAINGFKVVGCEWAPMYQS